MNDQANPESAVADLVGRRVWGAEQGHGSFLDLQFGEPRPDDPRRGAYHLWVSQCAWRIEHGGELGAGSEDAPERIAAALHRLDGGTVTGVTFLRPSLSTIFEFGEHRLVTFAVHTDPSEEHAEQWLLFRPDGQVLTVGPGPVWRLSPADQP
ncbi:MAG TPA: hypothetical protein VK020_13225 [Microlunatus sp.]|nr:hypothetical protein [Microlunatus sp.]